MALVKHVTMRDDHGNWLIGEYWRVKGVYLEKTIIRPQPSQIRIELWADEASRRSGGHPILRRQVVTTQRLESVAEAYQWLKANYRPLTGAQDA